MTQHPNTRRVAILVALAVSLLAASTALGQQRTAATIQTVLAVSPAGNASAGCGGGNGFALSSTMNALLGQSFNDEDVSVENRRVAYRICDSLTGTGAGGWTGDSAIPQESYDALSAALAPEEVFAQMDNANASFDLQTGNVARRLALVRLARRDAGRRDVEIARRAAEFDGNPSAIGGAGFAQRSAEDRGGQVLLALQEGVNAGDGTEGSGLGFFLNGRVSAVKGESNSSERGSDGFGGGFTLGVDTALGDELFVGGAIGYTHIRTHYDGSGSESDLDALTFTGYGGFYPADTFYVDGSVAISWLGFDNKNELVVFDGGPAPGTLQGETDGVNFGFDMGVGVPFTIEGDEDDFFAGLTIEPNARLNFLYTFIEGFSQGGADNTLNLSIDDQETESLTFSMGFRSEYPVSTRFGVLTPYFRAAYVHEFLSENDDIQLGLNAFPGAGSVNLKAEATDSHYGNFGLGVAATLGQGLSQFVDYDVIAGHDNVTIHQVTAGLRLEY